MVDGREFEDFDDGVGDFDELDDFDDFGEFDNFDRLDDEDQDEVNFDEEMKDDEIDIGEDEIFDEGIEVLMNNVVEDDLGELNGDLDDDFDKEMEE